MKIEPINAATKASQRKSGLQRTLASVQASFAAHHAAALPTSTGATAAGSVRGLAAMNQILMRATSSAGASGGVAVPSGSLRELREVRAATLLVGVAALLALLGHVEQQRRVVRELLEAGEPVLGGVEARLQQPQRQRRERGHLPAPCDRFALELVAWHHCVHQAHLVGLVGVVEAAEEPDLLGLADAD